LWFCYVASSSDHFITGDSKYDGYLKILTLPIIKIDNHKQQLGVKKFVKRREYNCRQEFVARKVPNIALFTIRIDLF
jgi:hypothetical protein